MPKNLRNKPGQRVALAPDYDQGELSDKYSVAGLEESGHTTALDDDQNLQPDGGPAVTQLNQIADQVSATGNKVLARRLRALAKETSRIAAMGIQEGQHPNYIEDYTTVPEELPGQDANDVRDASQGRHGVLPFYDLHPASDKRKGPQPRGGVGPVGPASPAGDMAASPLSLIMAAAKKRKAEAEGSTVTSCPIEVYRRECLSVIENLDPKVYEAHEDEFHKIRDELKSLTGDSPKKEDGGEKNDVAKMVDDADSHLDDKPALTTSKKCKDCGCVSCKCASGKKASKIASKTGRVASGSPWDALKKSLKRTASNGGKYGRGEWDISTADFGKAVDLQINTRLDDGTPLIANTITFSLVHEDPKSRVATVEVYDAALTNRTHEVSVPLDKIEQFSQRWAKNAAKAAKGCLQGD